ncbi:hypothetical protein [Amycolatopsis vastitatis]|uniref:LppX_LprAFG lipoprotein n=1 Tax=Amycolatopsis vastitatis TaxID=1905142 RepID=A0A229SRW7_9PSEU|nr:hypothetical protein [Amycolatopsis vastitatis]OXM61434.1 hypothetical protein CF165_38870 [Amycolatopsis vastitatis]
MRKTGLIIAAAALALTACDPGPAAAPPAAPATLTAPVTDVAQLVAGIRAGIAETPSATFAMTAVLGTTTSDVPGSLTLDGGRGSLTMVIQGSETRVIHGRTYTRMPQEIIPGKQWMGADPDSADPVSRAMAGGEALIQKLPDLGWALLVAERSGRIVSAEQTRLGTQPVNHYRLEIDGAKAPELFPEFAHRGADDKVDKPMTAKLPAELWLDAARRPVRFAVDLTTAAPKNTQGDPTVKATTDYRGWGKAVEIPVPPADQVADIAELMKKMGT